MKVNSMFIRYQFRHRLSFSRVGNVLVNSWLHDQQQRMAFLIFGCMDRLEVSNLLPRQNSSTAPLLLSLQ